MAQLDTSMQLVDWLDDLCVRFIINLPQEELESVERICFQIEEAQWFYEDFIRPLDTTLPSLNLRKFCSLIFQHCPLLSQFSEYHAAAYAEFLAYKTRVPVRGAIMLNEDMDHCVLVKGWKKGAKWSFPRGKINKDEKDLDCAIREVYEETGYDIKEAGLVPDEDTAKYIEMSLREQHMRLYVFRGVPMDTYFAPRTRKEISKIHWYRISDLPAGKLKQQVAKEQDPNNGSHFYMVAPFLGQLKGWIKQQKKLDRQAAGLAPAETVAHDDAGFGTDLEAVQGAISAGAPEVAGEAEAEAGHLQFLLARLQQSSQEEKLHQAPESQPSQTDKLATELKRLLSIGGTSSGSVLETSVAGDPGAAEAPAPRQKDSLHKSSLMSLLRPESSSSFPPHTPLEQINLNPPEAQTPQPQHPRQIGLSKMPPPPPFPYSPHYGQQYPPPPKHKLSFVNNTEMHHPPPRGPQFQGPSQQPLLAKKNAQISFNDPQVIQTARQQPVPSQMANPHLAGAQGASVLSGPGLPPPKLNAHSLSLLNTFKTSSQTPDPVSAISHRPQSLELSSENVKHAELKIHPQDQPLELSGNGALAHRRPSNPAFAAMPFPPPSNQKQTLLGLFRNPSSEAPQQVQNVRQPVPVPGLVELSAQPIPQNTLGKAATQKPFDMPPAQPGHGVDAFRDQYKLTTATVSGPLNAPDFETARRYQRPVELGSGHPQYAPRQIPHSALQGHGPQQFHPRGILPTASPPVPVHHIGSSMVLEAPQPFHPSTILQRQQQLTPANLPSMPPPQLPGAFDRRGTMQADQKSALMSLFGKPAGVARRSASPAQQQPRRRVSRSGSPGSPIPDRRVPVNARGAGGVAPRSRMSSFAEEGKANGSGPQTPIDPADKKFLLGYLENFVSKGL